MTFTPPLIRLVEEVASQASLVTDLLPGGWHHLYVPSVDRPVVLGPGGVFVLDVRHHSTMPLGLQPDRPWAHDHRNQMSTPCVTAELASQLLSWACGMEVTVNPVIVLTSGAPPHLTRDATSAGRASKAGPREPLLSAPMHTESSTINYAAAAISTVGAVAGLASAVLPRGPRDTAARIALISGLLGLVGTIAWLLAARSDHQAATRRAAAV